MRLENYTIDFNPAHTIFEFISIGVKGAIKKRIQFQSTEKSNVFNLAFGDVNSLTDDFDDVVTTNNGDSQKVLATVALSVLIFTEKYPDAIVFATGSTPSRTRLYKIGISNNLEELQEIFHIFGLTSDFKSSVYQKNEDYIAFYVKRKNK